VNEVAALAGAVFLASVLGSLHCAGMCGPFLLFAVGADSPRVARAHHLHVAYHVGRLLTYIVLGIVAGLVGQALDFGGAFVGVQRAAAVAAGALMIAFGIGATVRVLGGKLPKPPVPRFLHTLVSRGHSVAMDLEPTQRALAIGLLTTLLPCGWLYAFAIVAAGTGSPVLGGATMAAFWAGTLPVMVSLGVGLRVLTGPLRKHVPLITSLTVVAVGIGTVLGRVTLPAMSSDQLGAAVPTSLHESPGGVGSIRQDELPCCSNHQP